MNTLQRVIRYVRCERCEYEWHPLVNDPKVCPRCKRYDWKKKAAKREAGGTRKIATA